MLYWDYQKIQLNRLIVYEIQIILMSSTMFDCDFFQQAPIFMATKTVFNILQSLGGQSQRKFCNIKCFLLRKMAKAGALLFAAHCIKLDGTSGLFFCDFMTFSCSYILKYLANLTDIRILFLIKHWYITDPYITMLTYCKCVNFNFLFSTPSEISFVCVVAYT